MSDQKSHQFKPPLYHQGPGSSRKNGGKAAANGDAGNGDAGNEQKGWDAYRKWLSSVNGKARSERAPVDHSIYSWKGYHNWADRIRQSWKSEDS